MTNFIKSVFASSFLSCNKEKKKKKAYLRKDKL